MHALKDVHVVNVSRYRFPVPPSQHTLNWRFWSYVREQVGRLTLVCQVEGREDYVADCEGIRFVGIAAGTSRLWGRLRFLWRARRAALREIRTHAAPHLLWASDDVFGNLVVGSLSRQLGLPMLLELQGSVFSSHEGLDPDWQTRLHSWVIQRGVERASRVRVCCGRHRERAREVYGAENTVVIPTRVDTGLFDPERVGRGGSRDRLALDDGMVTFVSTANLIRGKGLQDFVEALADVPGRCRYLVVGAGPMREELEALARERGVDLQLLGRMPHEKVREVLAAGDVFVLPSYREGMPRAVLEAQSMGLPVIATNVDGIPEQVAPGSGILVEPGDIPALTAAAQRLGDPRLRADMARSAREHVARNHEQAVVFARWGELLQEVVTADG